MTPADPGAQLDHEADAEPVFQFRARLNADAYPVEVGGSQSVNPPLRGSPFDRPELDADRLAHRPTERDQLAREARRLAAQGLTARDVAAALRLSDAAVRALLAEVLP